MEKRDRLINMFVAIYCFFNLLLVYPFIKYSLNVVLCRVVTYKVTKCYKDHFQVSAIAMLTMKAFLGLISKVNNPGYPYLLFFSDDLEFLPTSRGKRMILYRGHTFTHNYKNTLWYCSRRPYECKVKIHTTADGRLVDVYGNHNHPPPRMVRSADGKIFKLP